MEYRKIVIITQARVGSTRLPKKILLNINGETLLETHLKRLKKVNNAYQVIVATTKEEGVDKILEIAKNQNVKCFQGSTSDVLDRFYKAAINEKADLIVRITSDCPLIDPQLISSVIDMMKTKKLDYCANVLVENFPDGQDIEVMTINALKIAWEDAFLKSDREHVTTYIRNNGSFNGGNLFKTDNYPSPKNMNHIRMTVDEKEDYEAIKTLVDNMGYESSWLEYANYIESNNNQFTNQKHIRNEGLSKSLHIEIKK